MKKNTKQKIGAWYKKQIKQRMDRKNYPGAPSIGPGVLRLYEEYFKKAIGRKKKAKVLILGATPESRDLALKHGHELVTVDINMEVIIKWGSIMKFKNHPDEIIVRCNWLNMPLKSSYFDLVMGDGVSNNIPVKKYGEFFKEIKRLLKPNGYILLREAVLNPKRQIRKIEEIDADLLHKKIHWFDAFIDFWLYSDISSKAYDDKTFAANLDKLTEKLEKEYKKKRISKKSLKVFDWCKGSGARIVLPRQKLEKILKKYFKLIPVKQAQDYKVTKDTFLFFLGRNKK